MENLKHEGLRPQRLDLMPERVFAEEWQKENQRQGAVNFGLIALELILNTKPLGHLYADDIDHPTQRDATVAATIIQWLGTRCGVCFLDRVHARIEQEREMERRRFDAKWNDAALRQSAR